MTGKIKHFVIILMTMFGTAFVASGQIDTEFWFVVPELSHRGLTGGTPGTLRLATLELEATVTISMPANRYDAVTNPTGFPDIVLTIPPNETDSVNLTHLIDVAAAPAVVGLENKVLTPSGINNYGLHISSTNVITAYWEVNYDYGSDLWTLKGQNGMGTEFYTPFQTLYDNRSMLPRAYSAIDVVATEDNTVVDFYLPPGIPASYGSAVTPVAAGGTYQVTLNQGQTFSLFPRNYSIVAAERLAGTRIEASAPISVTVKDDALRTGSQGQDLVGDQLVPTRIIGDNYIVPEMANPNHVYVLATENNTNIYVYDSDGAPIGPTPYTTIHQGEQDLVIIPGGSKFGRITSRINDTDPAKPFYTFQMAIENQSRGGAIVPAIGCTGNTQLAFTRARNNKFYFFIITEAGNEDKFLVDGFREDGIIDPGAFTPMAGSDGWVVWFSNSLPESTLSLGQHLIENTGGIFHLAIVNGRPAADGRLYYGYYSDFGNLNIGANVAGTNSSVVRACYGDPVQLYAFGGTTYSWTPDTYLDDPSSNLPTAINLPPGPHSYTVEVSGACGSGTQKLDVLVSTPVVAHVQPDVSSGCSPLEVTFEDQSVGAFSWQYDLGDGSPLIKYDNDPPTDPDPPPSPFIFTNTYYNTGTNPIYDTVTLLVKNSSGCADIQERTIVVFPEISSGFTVDDDEGCHPFEVNFTNNSSGNTGTWLWEFGDGGSSIDFETSHTYSNLFGPDADTLDAMLIATSPYLCRDTTIHPIVVNPYIEAKFAYDTVSACSPHEIILTNQSIGADSYLWDFGDGNTYTGAGPEIPKLYINNSNVPVTYTITLTVENAEGCTDQMQRDVTIYPSVAATFTASPTDACSPAEIAFQNNSIRADNFIWDFGDGGSSTATNPLHTYERNMTGSDITYTVSLVATSDELCRDTAFFDVVIHPYIEAAFTSESIVGCHPFDWQAENESIGATFYYWDFGDGSPVSNSIAPFINHTFQNNQDSAVEYVVELIVENLEGCADTTSRTITVHPEISANFTPDVFNGCHPLDVDFTDLSVNAVSYLWDFGDGAASTQTDPTHRYNNFGTEDTTYLATLTTSTADGVCVKTADWPILVHPQVKAEFTFEDALGCGPFEVTFNNLSIGGDAFFWDFGDGVISTPLLPEDQVHIYNNNSFLNSREYTVMLIATNDQGCSNTQTKKLTVYPDIQASFNVNADSGCQPLDVEFLNTSDGEDTYIWDFGDGSTSNRENPEHRFINLSPEDTVYRVSLKTVAPNNVCRDSTYIDIIVHSFVEADFTLPDDIGCTPFDVLIENSSVYGTEFEWTFGDGNVDVVYDKLPIIHQYINADFENRQEFEIRLEASNLAGCTSVMERSISVEPDIRAEIIPNRTSGCHPLTVNFISNSDGEAYQLWDFGNGTTSLAENPSQTFTNIGSADTTYTVWLKVTAPNNECTDSVSVDITVHPYINADFTFQDNINCTPSSVELFNSSIGGTAFTWYFDDGDSAVTVDNSSVSHLFSNSSYTDIAEFNVRLRAENPSGCVSERSKVVEVYPDVLAAFDASNIEGCHPLEVQFTNESFGDFSYDWNFGDGASSDAENPFHQFTNYTDDTIKRNVYLWIESEYKCQHDTSLSIIIHPKPLARFDMDKLIACPPFLVTAENTSLYADEYQWSYGDGTTQTVNTLDPVQHTYDNDEASIKPYPLKLLAITEFGCVDSAIQTVHVYPRTHALFSVNDAGCSPHVAYFDNESIRGDKYTWDFGGGTIMSSTNPSNLFFNYGGRDTIFEVSLLSTSINGCRDSISDTIYVYAQPDAEFDVTPTHQEYPSATVSIDNRTMDGEWSYSWTMGDGTGSNLRLPADYTYDTWGEYTISLKVETPYCSDSTDQNIRIFPTRPVALFDTVYPGCEPLDVQFNNQSLYGDQYLWEFDDGSSSQEFEPSHRFEEEGIYNVKLTVMGDGGMEYFYRTVEVYQRPEASFNIVPDVVMLPDQLVRFYNTSKYGEYYLWNFGDGFTSSDTSTTHLYSEVGIYDITLDVWTEHGCDDRAQKSGAVSVKGEGEIQFPNAFKPVMGASYKDGSAYYEQNLGENNEVFHPYWVGVKEYRLEIYNRWGTKLFESNEVNVGWNGYFKGELCTQGVYIWKVSGIYNNGEPFTVAGDVTLLHDPSKVQKN